MKQKGFNKRSLKARVMALEKQIEHSMSVDPRSLPCGATRGATTENSSGPHTAGSGGGEDELSAIHHALMNPMEVVYDPSETWTVRTAKEYILKAVKGVE